MPTPHINAKENDFAKIVLMPGDPVRAKWMAETFLTEYKQVTDVRGILGFTGKTKNGKLISIMASGMGMPSIGIYSYELFNVYGVKNIIRIGSAGSYTKDLNIYDVVIGKDAYSESTFALTAFGYKEDVMEGSKELYDKIVKTAKAINIPLHETRIHSSDVFYRQKGNAIEEVGKGKKCGCVEMESFALFANALALKKNAACLLTISDSLITHEETTAEERQTSFDNMIKIDDELLEGCKRFLDEMNRIELAKKKKKEEEKQALEQREARRNYWKKMLYSDEHQGMTMIIPEDSKLKK